MRRNITPHMGFKEANDYVLEHLIEFFGNRFANARYFDGRMLIGNHFELGMEGKRKGRWIDFRNNKRGDMVDLVRIHKGYLKPGSALGYINRMRKRLEVSV